jgi:hypothetical protein
MFHVEHILSLIFGMPRVIASDRYVPRETKNANCPVADKCPQKSLYNLASAIVSLRRKNAIPH